MSLSTGRVAYYRARVNDYGQGDAEVTFWVDKPAPVSNRRNEEVCTEERARRDGLNKVRSNRRSRKRIRQAVMSMPATYLWTLTYAENMQDRAQADADFEAFIDALRERYPSIKGQWTATAETQKRGAWHWHVVLPVRIPKPVMDNLWHHGFTFVGGPKRHKGPMKRVQAAYYLAKYVGKALDEGVTGQHAYKVGRGVVVPEVTLAFETEAEWLAFVLAFDQAPLLRDDASGFLGGGWGATWREKQAS